MTPASLAANKPTSRLTNTSSRKSGGLYATSAMQRLFRDAHAANAHVMFSPDLQGTIVGQHELGVKGPPPLM